MLVVDCPNARVTRNAAGDYTVHCPTAPAPVAPRDDVCIADWTCPYGMTCNPDTFECEFALE